MEASDAARRSSSETRRAGAVPLVIESVAYPAVVASRGTSGSAGENRSAGSDSGATGRGPASRVPLPLTISIYQNGEQVAGLLQQIYRQPLFTAGTAESSDQQASTSSSQRTARGDAKLTMRVPIPATPAVEIGGGVGRDGSVDAQQALSSRSTQNFVYSQAYYLALVRDALVQEGLVRTVSGAADLGNVAAGDFIEYTADFKANELGALLDVLTPEVIGRIVRARRMRTGIAKIASWSDLDEVRAHMLRIQTEADGDADLATKVTAAVQADFRTEVTREFYGSVGTSVEAVTMVTVCDNAHFVVEDPNRILDGRFTVLGKAVSAVENDVPVLARNKVLHRLRAQAVDRIFDELAKTIDTQTGSPDGSQILGGLSGSEVFDVRFASRIAGRSLRVVPLAIYA